MPKRQAPIHPGEILLEAHRAKHGEYPAADSMAELRSLLAAELAAERGVDRWGEPLIVTVTPVAYTLTSKGNDRQGGHENGGPVEAPGHSITLEAGVFVQYHRAVESTARKYEAEIRGVRAQSKPEA